MNLNVWIRVIALAVAVIAIRPGRGLAVRAKAPGHNGWLTAKVWP